MSNNGPDISFPLQLTINLTGLCGLNCSYCYAQPFSKLSMPVEKVFEVLSLAKERGAFVIKLAGGEPLLHPQFLEILDFILENKITVALLSSLAINRKYAERVAIAIKNAEHLIDFQVSLDSIRPNINNIARGKTDLVLQNIDLFLGFGLDIQIASVIADHNIDYLLEIVDTYYPRVKRFHFMNVMPSVKVSSNDSMINLTPHADKKSQFWRALLSSYGRKIITNPPTSRQCTDKQSCTFQGCSAGYLLCTVDSTLDIIACNMAKTFVLGNLQINTFNDIWNSSKATEIRAYQVPLCHTYISESVVDKLIATKSLHLKYSHEAF